MSTLAVLLTCHNRRAKTLACLEALAATRPPAGLRLHVVLVDDGSLDGTGAAIAERFPEVEVIRGDGSLFWSGGMRVAYARAMQRRYDDYLWLNDDTLLDPTALEQLYRCREQVRSRAPAVTSIVVGATRDASTGQLSYGGLYNAGNLFAHHYAKLPVGDEPQACIAFNGNCVLIPDSAASLLGNIDPRFVHSVGDWDYGLRARAAGIPLWVAPGFVGTCSTNDPPVFEPHAARSVAARLRHVCGPKQLPPRAWRAFVQRHFPLLWPVYFVRPYAGAVVRALRSRLQMHGPTEQR